MKKMLVVVDMQKDFIDGVLGSKDAVSIVPAVINKIKAYKEAKQPIYFTKDTHLEDYLDTKEGKNLPIPHCIRGSEGWHFQQEIEALVKASPVFEKGVFGSEELAKTLRNEIENPKDVMIELAGLCTDICVISNAILLKTYMPEVTIQVDAACCAGVTPKSHLNALEAMRMCQIQIINA